MSNNVLVIPGADFSNVAVENVMSVCNNYTGDLLGSGSFSSFDETRIFMLPTGDNYHDKPLAKLQAYSAGNSEISTDSITIYEITPIRGTSEGTYVFDNSEGCAKPLFTVSWNAATNDVVDIVFPTTITIPTGKYLGFKVQLKTRLTYAQNLGDGGNFMAIAASGETTPAADSYSRTQQSIGIYEIE